jgi:pyruvate/2-oxoglutarate dehydrogenase complex dihydrolipoamide dehydrogenase (E3) component
MLPALIPQEDADASKELANQFRRRGITLHLSSQCTKVEGSGSELTAHLSNGETVVADLMLVSTGRRPLVDRLGLKGIGIEFDPRTGVATDPRRRTTVPHIYAVGDCAGYWQLAHTAFREGEVAAQNACGHQAVVGNRAVPRPIYTEPESPASQSSIQAAVAAGAAAALGHTHRPSGPFRRRRPCHSRSARISLRRRALVWMCTRTSRTARSGSLERMADRIASCSAKTTPGFSNSRSSTESTIR